MSSRNERFDALKNQEFDVLIIGGGATGLGVALDALTRGYSVALVEQSDFAKGTSSKSTKLVHGGVRYLEQMNFKLVREALLERQHFYKNAPHLSESLPFVIPCYDYFSIPFFGAGLKLYDGLAGFPKGQCSSILSRNQTLADFPFLKKEGLKGGIQYYDGQFNDAQMAVALAQTVAEKGGVIQNYCEMVAFIKENNKICGAQLEDKLDKQRYEVKAKCVINASGVFSDEVRRLDEGQHKVSLNLAQGVHLVSKNSIDLKKAVLIPKTSDGRVLFCVPWQDVLILGTTDTKINAPVLEATALQEEVDFIWQGVTQYFPSLEKSDLLGQFAGIRPLAREEGTEQTKKTSREEKIIISDAQLVSIIGGKWTTYRHMSEKIMDTVIKHNLLPANKPSDTINTPIYGWLESYRAKQIPVTLRHYGCHFKALQAMPEFKDSIHPDLPYKMAEIEWNIKNSFVETLDDLLARRLRAFYINPHAALEAAPKVAAKMAAIMNKDQTWIDEQIAQVQELAKYYVLDSYVKA